MNATLLTQTEMDQIADALADAGVKGKFWTGAGKCRFYIQTGRRDAKVFIDWDGYGIASCSLEVFIDNCGQKPQWYASQRDLLKRQNAEAMEAVRSLTEESESREDVKPVDQRGRVIQSAKRLANGAVLACVLLASGLSAWTFVTKAIANTLGL